MKLVATILVAAFVLAVGIPMAYADCAGHTKAQLVQSDVPQLSSEQQANNATLPVEPKTVAQQTTTTKNAVKK